MIKLTLKDGSVREAESGISAAEIIKGIGMGLYKAACSVKLNGKLCDLRTPVTEDCEFEVLTFDSEEGKKTFKKGSLRQVKADKTVHLFYQKFKIPGFLQEGADNRFYNYHAHRSRNSLSA